MDGACAVLRPKVDKKRAAGTEKNRNFAATMDEAEVYYADVLLPLHLPGTYTYRVPREMVDEVQAGVRVVVQFGQKRMYSALVRRLHTEAPRWRAKYVLGVLDERPVVTERQMLFWEWMASYYMCYPGDVMAVALPAGMKLASESALSIHPDFDGDLSRLTKFELQVVGLLTDHGTMRVDDISHALGCLLNTSPSPRDRG